MVKQKRSHLEVFTKYTLLENYSEGEEGERAKFNCSKGSSVKTDNRETDCKSEFG